MNTEDILTTLAQLGKPQTAVIYRRHGSGERVFGVLTSEIAKLQKRIKRNHPLAMALWETGNAEARILALLVANPEQVTRSDADRWIQDGPVHFVGCYLSALLARSPIADETMRDWMLSSDERHGEMGYGILADRLKHDPDAISDAYAEQILTTIEERIHGSANWARYAMNNALISIGIYKPLLREQALAAAQRIGTVEIDHGETDCKTPSAASSIRKASTRKRCP
ncbi:MAG TPA: DNA alkylation repair protein [Gemmatimonas aurantiaca]|uniref:DNA alkylation repair protein n=2 Tax=Gemmatimonas aurantiaca TaxID=173480 RepID=C1ADZ9_GEMAT|nr:DNA alkylation repair protein [Gemmatimonas aurantiaca]BAH40726.1 hypothetical protein GAU_3684 [Gemmatimonas aurantiaca T-27]HCT59176.1 DNA alkylation repair protein [Gemmatimonas aurantiaca]